MEKDRYAHNTTLFIICMVCLLLCLSLFAFSFYLLPNFIWQWQYDLPEFIAFIRQWLIENHGKNVITANRLIFALFFLPALLTGLAAYLTANKIENEIHKINLANQSNEHGLSDIDEETVRFSLRLLLIIILVVSAIVLLQGFFLITT